MWNREPLALWWYIWMLLSGKLSKGLELHIAQILVHVHIQSMSKAVAFSIDSLLNMCLYYIAFSTQVEVTELLAALSTLLVLTL